MKVALESYWKGALPLDGLIAASHSVDNEAWKLQADAGIDLVGLDGTLYDQVLDTIFYLGLAPPRFKEMHGLQLYFAMARGGGGCCGGAGAGALDMSKFYDTNYHCLVPEFDASSQPSLNSEFVLEKVRRGQQAIGVNKAVPILIGPNTLVKTSKLNGVSQSDMVARLVPAYVQLLGELHKLGCPEVQLHEPALVLGDAGDLRADFESSYGAMAAVGLPIHLVTYYDDLGEDTYKWVVQLPVAAISLDFLGVPGAQHPPRTLQVLAQHGFPAGKRLGAGLVDGRSVWADNGQAVETLRVLRAAGITNLAVTSSVPLQHLPYDLAAETALPEGLAERLSFAVQKLQEMVTTAKAVAVVDPALGNEPQRKLQLLIDARAARVAAADAASAVDPGLLDRPLPYNERRPQQPSFHAFPTSTIGSFPQTAEIRRLRLQLKKGIINEADYYRHIDAHIGYAIGMQDALGIDVLVHGEAERTDMVEYFGTQLDGFAFTQAAWVQSYGSRYVRPPIIYSDVSRRGPMTVREFAVAQGLTKRPVKGMLTGPVTILNWSFPRKDASRRAQALQIAAALRQEVADLEAAGCAIIQVDEPALREGLPPKRERWDSYLGWAVDSFRMACAVAGPETQIVTHLCYSQFEDILPAIARLDADVLTIENSRSGDAMVRSLAEFGYSSDLGPGIYDVHSPVVPKVGPLVDKIRSFVAAGALGGDFNRLWVNPDCGLKTRTWDEVIPSLRNMVEAAAVMRAEVGAKAG